MAYTVLQAPSIANPGGTASTVAKAFTSNVTAGSMIVAIVNWSDATGSVTNVRDNINGAVNYTSAASLFVGAGKSQQVFFFPNSASGAMTVTATLASGQTAPCLSIFEVSGTGQFVRNFLNSAPTSATPTFGPISVINGDLVISGIRSNANISAGSGAPWTTQTTGGSVGSEYQVANATNASFTAQWTVASSVSNCGVLISFATSTVVVPNVAGLTVAQGEAAIVAVGLQFTEVSNISPTVPAGGLVSINPVAGTTVANGSVVTVLISTGPAPEALYDGNQALGIGNPTTNLANLWDNPPSSRNTEWVATVANTSYAGVDVGTAIYPTRVRFISRGNYEDTYIGCKIQGSNDNFTNSTTIFNLTTRAIGGGGSVGGPLLPNELDLTSQGNGATFRYLRILTGSSLIKCCALQFFGTFPAGANGRAVEPVCSPNGGHYKFATRVRLSSLTTDATIYYTLDGSTPTTSSTQYTGPIVISANTTLQAIAARTGLANSLVSSTVFYVPDNWVPADYQFDITRNYRQWAVGAWVFFDPPSGYWYQTGYNWDEPDGYSAASGGYQLDWNLYRSVDFLNWTYAGTIAGLVSPAGQNNGTHHFRSDLPRILYNAANNNYVAWVRNWNDNVQGSLQTFVSSSLQGPYTVVNTYANATSGVTLASIPCTVTSGAPGTISRTDAGSWVTDGILTGYSIKITGSTGGVDDGVLKAVTGVSASNLTVPMTSSGSETLSIEIFLNFLAFGDDSLFQDDDGTLYFLKNVQNTHWATYLVTADYQSLTTTVTWHHTGIWTGNQEGWTLVKNSSSGTYFLMYSDKTNFITNLNHYVTANSPMAATASWSAPANPFVTHSNPSDTTSYNTQITTFVKIPGRNAYLWVGARFNDAGTDVTALPWFDQSKNIMLPLSFPTGTTMRIPWADSWNLDASFPTISGAPVAPTILSANGKVIIWKNNHTGPYALYLDRSTDAAMSVNVVSEVLTQGQTTFTDQNQSSNVQYYYQVRAVNANGTSTSQIIQAVMANVFPAPFTGSIPNDDGTVGTFYIQCVLFSSNSQFSFNWWKCASPWGYAQGYNLAETVKKMFDNGPTPARVYLETGKSVWNEVNNVPQTQTAPDTTHEVGSK
jgi:Chitobiase/beta-hexosaminidase C-terminal domain/PASTA domain